MSLPNIVIYVAPNCGYCQHVLELFDSKQVAYSLIDVGGEPQKRAEMRERAGGRNSVPQIFIGETHVGGCDDLIALEEAKKLDDMIAGK